MKRVTVEIAEGVADVRLNRPDKLNALDPEMFEALIETGENLSRAPSLRAVVLSGNGRAFSAGLDFGAFAGLATGPDSSLLRATEPSGANWVQRAAYVWQEVPVPVIAAVHGYAFGGGLQIALGADIRVTTADAQFSVMEIKWGLVPDMSGTQTLRRLVRLDVAKELTFTGRKVSGTEAVQLGLATRLSDSALDDALALARQVASQSPDAIRAAKRLLNEAGLVSLKEGFRLEAELQGSLLGGPNQVEAIQANLERRAPVFSDPE